MVGAFLEEVAADGVVLTAVLLATVATVGGSVGNEVEVALRDACPPRNAVSI